MYPLKPICRTVKNTWLKQNIFCDQKNNQRFLSVVIVLVRQHTVREKS